jgi:LysM repeat protein
MLKVHLKFVLVSFLLMDISSAKVTVDCRVVTGGVTECNPFSLKFLKAKEIKYTKDKQKLIVDKTLPVPKKIPLKVISVADMIEKYVKVEDSMRFKGSRTIPLISNASEEQKRIQKSIQKKKLETKQQRAQTRIEKLKIQREALLKKMQKIKEEREQKRVESIKLAKEQEKKKLEALRVAEVKKRESVEEKYTKKGFYTIQPGDSLSTIASKFSMKTATLRTLNQLNKTSAIRIGKKLIIPYTQKRVDAIVDAKYIVEAGDSLGTIARDFNVSSSAIIKLNKLKKSATIRIGQKILLPLPHKLAEIKAAQKRLLVKQKKEKAKKEKLAKLKSKKEKKYSYKSKMIRGFGKRKLRVTATAYSSHRAQTDKTPFLAAWNNRIRPGMKIIAVSRDMLTRYGLRNGSKVKIGGLPGYYTVRDKMNKRFRKRIDIYMGVNRRRALRWGRRSVMLYW